MISSAACSGGGSDAFPEGSLAVSASNDVAVGANRLLVGVSLPDGTRLGSPNDPVTFAISPRDDPTAVERFPAQFVWIVDDVVGIYRANVETDRPGVWSVVVESEDGAEIAPAAFQVKPDPATPALGTPAISIPTPTLDDLPLEELTTDPEPDPSFYGLSLDDALDSGRPTVVVFATPAFCKTASCGPMLDNSKAVAPRHPGVDFVHVEVYQGFGKPGFAPDAAHLAPAVRAWGLPSEPWVFVADAGGTIVAKFEGVLDPAELDEALSSLGA